MFNVKSFLAALPFSESVLWCSRVFGGIHTTFLSPSFSLSPLAGRNFCQNLKSPPNGVRFSRPAETIEPQFAKRETFPAWVKAVKRVSQAITLSSSFDLMASSQESEPLYGFLNFFSTEREKKRREGTIRFMPDGQWCRYHIPTVSLAIVKEDGYSYRKRIHFASKFR